MSFEIPFLRYSDPGSSSGGFYPGKGSWEKDQEDGSDLVLRLKATTDIAESLGRIKKPSQLIAGFALETDNELANARAKLLRKNLDIIVLNSLNEDGAGFGHDTNKVTIIDGNNNIDKFELKSKEEAAKDILNKIVSMIKTEKSLKMVSRFKYYLVILLVLLPGISDGQELNCNVQISAQRIQGQTGRSLRACSVICLSL